MRGNDFMRFRTRTTTQLAALIGFAAAFMLWLGSFGSAAPQDDAKPPAKGKVDEPKKGAPKPAPKRGLHVNDAKALQGFTLMSPLMSNRTYLLDMQGRVVRTWQSESSTAMTTTLLENGHVLRHAKVAPQTFGDGPGAGGHFQEFGWDGEVIWDFKFASTQQLAHHDVCRMPNGNLLLIVWEKKTAEEAVAAGRRAETVKGTLLPDCIFEIHPEGKSGGKVVWEWRVWDHLIQDHDSSKANYGNIKSHPELIDINFGDGTLASIVAKDDKDAARLRAYGYLPAKGAKPASPSVDWLHCNAVDYNPDLDQIILNCPEFNEFWIIDHSTTTAEAAAHKGGKSGKGGDLLYRWGNPRAYRSGDAKDQKLFFQHNTHWIPKGLPGAGHVLVFNNGRKRFPSSHSSVDELMLPVSPDGRYDHKPGKAFGPEEPVWSYTDPKKTAFYSDFISGAQRLPNGNTFICAGGSGTLFEVTQEKEIVWKYLNPAQPEAPPGGAAPALAEILPAVLRTAVKVTDDQSKRLDELSRETEDKVQTLLTEDQKKLLAKPAGPTIGPPPAPQVIQVVSAAIRSRLKLTDAQKKQLDTLQKEGREKLDAILTGEQREELKKTLAGFVNAWAGGPGPGGGGGGAPNLGAAVFRSYRYPLNHPGLQGKVLTPGKTIEELQAKPPEKKG
jgi:Spy/CpxP family protein refolding chaperone